MKLIIHVLNVLPRSCVSCTKLEDAGSPPSVRGISAETSTFLYSKRPFEINHLPESVKLEVICADESIGKIVKLVVRAARTGTPGDGIIALQDVEKVLRIRHEVPRT